MWTLPTFFSFSQIVSNSKETKEITMIICHFVFWIDKSCCIRQISAWGPKIWLNKSKKQYANVIMSCRAITISKMRCDKTWPAESAMKRSSRTSGSTRSVPSMKGRGLDLQWVCIHLEAVLWWKLHVRLPESCELRRANRDLFRLEKTFKCVVSFRCGC